MRGQVLFEVQPEDAAETLGIVVSLDSRRPRGRNSEASDEGYAERVINDALAERARVPF